MIKILTVIGARPQIIKAAALSREINNSFSAEIEEKILHTGQHYDANMSQVFFDELGIPVPNYNLGVGSGFHGEQTAKMISGIEKVLLKERFDGIVLYGDTNSTLAGAVAASKIHVPIFHIEAGLRSFNMAMPEEVNRIVCDQLSSVLFAPTQTAVDNLAREGFNERIVTFNNGKHQKIVNSGDIMYDNSLYFGSVAEKSAAYSVLESNGLRPNEFILATVHRNNNTDDSQRLTSIFKALLDIASQSGQKVVLPLHPRTAKLLKLNLEPSVFSSVVSSDRLVIIPPASFLEIIVLEKNCSLVMTDSGGVQKESFFFRKPCVIMRPETEWVEIVQHGAGILADARYSRIVEAYFELLGRNVVFPSLFGDGFAAEKICNEIVKYLN